MMNKLEQAALDLLEGVEAAIKAGDWKVDGACDPDIAMYRLREALAEQNKPQKERRDFMDGYDAGMADAKRIQQAEQEPVAWMGTDTNNNPNKFRLNPFSNCVPLYATPVRTKDLTDDEITDLYFEGFSIGMLLDFARAVIAADRGKNK